MPSPGWKSTSAGCRASPAEGRRGQTARQRHRVAGGVGRGDQFLGAGAAAGSSRATPRSRRRSRGRSTPRRPGRLPPSAIPCHSHAALRVVAIVTSRLSIELRAYREGAQGSCAGGGPPVCGGDSCTTRVSGEGTLAAGRSRRGDVADGRRRRACRTALYGAVRRWRYAVGSPELSSRWSSGVPSIRRTGSRISSAV